MTTIAMGAGMMPIALGFGTDPSFRAPMAIVVIGGLITSTFLSLLVVPVVFTFVDDMVQWFASTLAARFPHVRGEHRGRRRLERGARRRLERCPICAPAPTVAAGDPLEFELDRPARHRAVPVRLYWPTPGRSFAGSAGGVLPRHRRFAPRLRLLRSHLVRHGVASLHLQHVGSDRHLWFGNPLGMLSRLQDAAQEHEAIAARRTCIRARPVAGHPANSPAHRRRAHRRRGPQLRRQHRVAGGRRARRARGRAIDLRDGA